MFLVSPLDESFVPVWSHVADPRSLGPQILPEILFGIEGIFLVQLDLQFLTVFLAQDEFVRPFFLDAEKPGTGIIWRKFLKEKPRRLSRISGLCPFRVPDKKIGFGPVCLLYTSRCV